MKINISSECFFHPIIIKKDVMNIRFNLKTADRKKHNFLFQINQQTRGCINRQGLVNILRREAIIYYSINFEQRCFRFFQ